jgi:hypothetical protein
MIKARLLTKEPLSPRLAAASAALDEALPEHHVVRFVRLYQKDPPAMRVEMRAFLAEVPCFVPEISSLVQDRLILLGIIDQPKKAA